MPPPTLGTAPNAAAPGHFNLAFSSQVAQRLATIESLRAPGDYTTSTPCTTLQHGSQLSGAVYHLASLLDFQSHFYVPVSSVKQSWNSWVASTAMQIVPNLLHQKNKPSPSFQNKLHIVKPNPQHSPYTESPNKAKLLKTIATGLQNFVDERAWPEGHTFPTIAVLPKTVFDWAGNKIGSIARYGVAPLKSGAIVIDESFINHKQTEQVLAALQQTLIQQAFNLDPIQPTYADNAANINVHVLAPGIGVGNQQGVCLKIPQGLDCTATEEYIKRVGPQAPVVFYAFTPEMASVSNPVLTGFADLFGKTIRQLQKKGFGPKGKGAIISMAAGTAGERHIVSNLLPQFSMYAIDPVYLDKNEPIGMLAKRNLVANDFMTGHTANQFTPSLGQFCKTSKPCIIIARNIESFSEQKNIQKWTPFFKTAWQWLKDKKALAIVVTGSGDNVMKLMQNALQQAFENEPINIQHNKAALQTRTWVQTQEGTNHMIYAAGLDSWFVSVTARPS